MPAKTEKQRKFMRAELARKRAGKKTKTRMTAEQLRDFAKKRAKGKSTKQLVSGQKAKRKGTAVRKAPTGSVRG